MILSNLKNYMPYYVTVIFLLVFSSPAWAENSVSGNFSSASGTTIVLNLTIHFPPPAALIVEVQIPPVNHIVATSPTAKKIHSKNGKVKWLFKNVKNNRLTLTTTLQSPLRGKVRAIVRYHTPQSNKMTEFIIDS